jgi:AraC-like DNA-binding protein
MVFPRTSVYITHNGRSPVVADPNVVIFYNQGQEYQRSKLSEQGDICDWFAFCPALIVEAIRPFDPSVEDRQETPFTFTHGPSEARSYLLQRLLIKHLREAESPNYLYIEETIFTLLSQTIANFFHLHGISRQKRETAVTQQQHRDLVEATKAILATRFQEELSITQIAQAVYSSPYHLCRLFRHYTGQTIHSYLNQLRLRTALDYMAQPEIPITQIGLEMGYSSHSHFTQAFRQTFGTSPSAFRHTTTHHQSQLSNFLIV